MYLSYNENNVNIKYLIKFITTFEGRRSKMGGSGRENSCLFTNTDPSNVCDRMGAKHTWNTEIGLNLSCYVRRRQQQKKKQQKESTQKYGGNVEGQV